MAASKRHELLGLNIFWTVLSLNGLLIPLHILAYVFNFISRQCYEVWASYFTSYLQYS